MPSRLPARSVAERVPPARSDPFVNPLEGQPSQSRLRRASSPRGRAKSRLPHRGRCHRFSDDGGGALKKGVVKGGPAPQWGASRTDRRGSGDPHREKSHWDFSRPSCAVFSGTQGRGTLSHTLQAFCKKLDQKLFILLYRPRFGKPSPKTPVSERSERIGVFPAPRGHAPGHGHREGGRGRVCRGRLLLWEMNKGMG